MVSCWNKAASAVTLSADFPHPIPASTPCPAADAILLTKTKTLIPPRSLVAVTASRRMTVTIPPTSL